MSQTTCSREATLLSSAEESDFEDQIGCSPSPGSPRDRDTRFYKLLAGGARTRLLEAFLDLGLPELLGSYGTLSAREISDQLSLDPHRSWKFLHLLSMTGLLEESHGEKGEFDALYSLSDSAKEYFGEDGTQGYFFRDLVNFWRAVAVLPMVDVLRGMPLPAAVKWPPQEKFAAEHLEVWMRVTAEGAIKTLLQSGAMEGAKRVLDVGGGDGTIACALARAYPETEFTVFNLPESAFLARRNIAEQNLGGRVKAHVGDFLKDELPKGFDRIIFSRVLTDWTPKVCLMLMEKSRRALSEDGRLVINEALVDGNQDYAISWEFRYIFYDTFGRAMFKPLEVYKKLLEEAGFDVVRVAPMLDEAFYSVVEAVPCESPE